MHEPSRETDHLYSAEITYPTPKPHLYPSSTPTTAEKYIQNTDQRSKYNPECIELSDERYRQLVKPTTSYILSLTVLITLTGNT